MMNLFGSIYEVASHSNLKKKYFVKQIQTKHPPKVTTEMLKKLDNNITLFGNTIKKGDFLLMGLIINDIIPEKELRYNFFYCTKEELKLLGTNDYYVSETKNGIPKVVSKKLIIKFGKQEGIK